MIVIMSGAALLTGIVVATFVLRRRGRRRHEVAASELGPIRSAVRVLTTDDDLREAVERALLYERRTADRTRARMDRYSRIAAEQLPFDVTGEGNVTSFEASIVRDSRSA